MPFARIGDLRLGDTVRLEGLTCVNSGETRELLQTDEGQLYFQCNEGKHFIDGQVDNHGNYVGMTLEWQNPIDSRGPREGNAQDPDRESE
jgi:hypothetical protein